MWSSNVASGTNARTSRAYLPKGKQDEIKKALQNAYDLPTYREAKAALDALKPELTLINEDATKSLEEGLEETLSLHRLRSCFKIIVSPETEVKN